MRTSPSIVPSGAEQDTYLALGWIGCCWRETDKGSTEREAVIRALVDGEFSKPVRIVAFNTAEGCSRDVTVEIAEELSRRYGEFGEVPKAILDFMDANRH